MNRVSTYSFSGYSLPRQRAFTKADALLAKVLYKVILLGVLTVFLALFCIWTRTQVVHLGYEINALNSRQNEYKTINRQLQMELSLLKSPKRLEEIVGKKMGMGTPSLSQIQEIGKK